MNLKKAANIDWEMCYGLMLDTIYGGRIDNNVDMRILSTYVKQYFNDKTINGKKELSRSLNVSNINDFHQILSDDDTPELYGLPNGIDKAVMKLKSKSAL